MSERIKLTPEQRAEKPCPCGHLHPAGIGVGICICNDCWLLFGGTPRTSLSPLALARLEELEATR